MYDAILDEYWGPGARAGIFFASAGVILAILVTNAGSNSLPVGADLSGIWPKWLNIVRGQILCALLAPLLVPWLMISSASAFLTFLGSYPTFLMPVIASMIIDYWLVRRGNIHVPSLYVTNAHRPYTYHKGWNVRMVVAWICGVASTIHGLAGSLNPGSVSQGSTNLYKISFFVSGAVGGAVYYASCLVWPPELVPTDSGLDHKLRHEELAETEGYLPGEDISTITGIGVIHGVNTSENTSGENVSDRSKGIKALD